MHDSVLAHVYTSDDSTGETAVIQGHMTTSCTLLHTLVTITVSHVTCTAEVGLFTDGILITNIQLKLSVHADYLEALVDHKISLEPRSMQGGGVGSNHALQGPPTEVVGVAEPFCRCIF